MRRHRCRLCSAVLRPAVATAATVGRGCCPRRRLCSVALRCCGARRRHRLPARLGQLSIRLPQPGALPSSYRPVFCMRYTAAELPARCSSCLPLILLSC